MTTTITQEELIETLGPSATNRIVARHRRLAFVPSSVLLRLASTALTEHWGKDHYALEKYIAVNVAWAIEQGKFSAFGEQFSVTAGQLRTRYGTPIYLVYERNRNQGQQPFVLKLATSDVRTREFPSPPEIPDGKELPPGAEIVMKHEHMFADHQDRLQQLASTPPVAQLCAISGAIQWSLKRGLYWKYWYFGRLDYIVPLYLSSRENITEAPDVVAPLQVHDDNLLVRTLLLPHFPYANARVAVERHDQLPHWLVDSWKVHAKDMPETSVDDPEGDE